MVTRIVARKNLLFYLRTFADVVGPLSRGFYCISLSLVILMSLTVVEVVAYDSHSYDRLMHTGNCVDCDLSSANLENMDLSGSDLRGSDLTNTVLRQANLYKADLFGAIILGTDLSRAQWIDGKICKEKSVGYCR